MDKLKFETWDSSSKDYFLKFPPWLLQIAFAYNSGAFKYLNKIFINVLICYLILHKFIENVWLVNLRRVLWSGQCDSFCIIRNQNDLETYSVNKMSESKLRSRLSDPKFSNHSASAQLLQVTPSGTGTPDPAKINWVGLSSQRHSFLALCPQWFILPASLSLPVASGWTDRPTLVVLLC